MAQMIRYRLYAGMAELADAHGSGPCGSNTMRVQVPFPAFFFYHFERGDCMTISPGMLLFAIIDSAIAFLLVFSVTKAKFGGDEKTFARLFAATLGTIVFCVYLAVIVWFNTEPSTVSIQAKMVVYLAPIVLSILMTALVLLSLPPKKKEDEEETEEEKSEENEKEETEKK